MDGGAHRFPGTVEGPTQHLANRSGFYEFLHRRFIDEPVAVHRTTDAHFPDPNKGHVRLNCQGFHHPVQAMPAPLFAFFRGIRNKRRRQKKIFAAGLFGGSECDVVPIAGTIVSDRAHPGKRDDVAL